MRVNYSYVRVPSVTRTLDNSNLLLTGRNFCFPFRSLIYIFLPKITRTIKKKRKQEKTIKTRILRVNSWFFRFFPFTSSLFQALRYWGRRESERHSLSQFSGPHRSARSQEQATQVQIQCPSQYINQALLLNSFFKILIYISCCS